MSDRPNALGWYEATGDVWSTPSGPSPSSSAWRTLVAIRHKLAAHLDGEFEHAIALAFPAFVSDRLLRVSWGAPMEWLIELWQRANAVAAPFWAYISSFTGAPAVALAAFASGMAFWVWRRFSEPVRKRREEQRLQRVEAQLAHVRLPPAYSELTPAQVLRLPTSVIVADYGVIPFDDNRGLLGTPDNGDIDTLLGWATTGDRVSARLYVAAGGFGKTRLALEAANQLASRGWRAGLLDREALEEALIKPRSGRSALSHMLDERSGKGIFLVIDYAETRIEQVRALAAVLAGAMKQGPPIRVALLARTDQWWEGFLESLSQDQEILLERDARRGPAVDMALEHRRAFFDSACEAFAERLKEADALSGSGAAPLLAAGWREQSLPADVLSWDGSPIYLAFQAFLHVRGNPLTRSPLSEMAREERHHHARALGQAGLGDARRDAMTAACAVLTLAQGVSPEHVRENVLGKYIRIATLATLQLSDDDIDQARDEIRTAIQKLYGRGDTMRPILPDILGECVVAEVLASAPNLLDQLLQAAPFATLPALIVTNRGTRSIHTLKTQSAMRAALEIALPERLETAATHLISAALADLGDIQSVAADALRESPRRAAAGRALVASAARLVNANATPARLRAFLREAALAAKTFDPIVRSDPSRERMADAAAEADARATLLASAGERAEALAASEEAEGLYQALFDIDASPYKARLAACLNNLSNRLADCALRARALQAILKSVTLYRELVEEERDSHLRDLCMALIGLSHRLSEVDRGAEALAAAEESVSQIRDLVAVDRLAFGPDLAIALANLALRLRQSGRLTEAVAASTEAVGVTRELASADADAFSQRLADALLNLSGDRSLMGDKEPALVAVREAMGHYRKLVVADADAFVPGLAASLSAAASQLSALGHGDEACAASQEALGLYRSLVDQDRTVFLPGLARCLVTHFVSLNVARAFEASAQAIEEAVALYRELCEAEGALFEPDLAMALHNLSVVRGQLGQFAPSINAGEESVTLYRTIAVGREVVLPDLAAALANLGGSLNALGRRQEALDVLLEAASIERGLAQAFPSRFSPSFANALHVLAAQQSALNMHAEAQQSSAEAVELYRKLAAQSFDAFAGRLAAALGAFGGHLSLGGKCSEACKVSHEALELFQQLVQQRRASDFELAMASCRHGDVLFTCGKAQESAASYERGLKDLLKISDTSPDQAAPRIKLNAHNLAKAMHAAGHDEIEIRRRLESIGVAARDVSIPL